MYRAFVAWGYSKQPSSRKSSRECGSVGVQRGPCPRVAYKERRCPPAAPWWGGFWERLIRLLKSILRKVPGRACLSEEELVTVLCDAESSIISRPLTYLSEDLDELSALTPSTFLQEIRKVGVLDVDMINSKRLNKRCTHRQKLRQKLRNRFRNEYLEILKNYSKVKGESSIKEEVILF
ncbi:integrase catalytic domain-containing protein [Trichonephila clavipes]|nr:integrase catalytic domain-containing protein [Trichonephila clavipes]